MIVAEVSSCGRVFGFGLLAVAAPRRVEHDQGVARLLQAPFERGVVQVHHIRIGLFAPRRYPPTKSDQHLPISLHHH